MTLAAPRSRQGRLTLVLAILAVGVAAAIGAFSWANQASALPNTTVSWFAAPASGAVNPGDTLFYDAHYNLQGGGSTGNTVFTVDLPDNLTNITDFGSSCGGGVLANGAGNVYTCTVAAGVAAGLYFIHVSGDAPASGSIGSAGASVCDTVNCEPASGFVDSGTTQTVNGVTCTGGGTFLAGSNQTVTCTVPAGLTYCSDNDEADPRTFVVGDMPVVLAGGATIVTPQAAGLAAATSSDTATVTVTGPVGGSASVTLSTHLSSSDNGPADCTATEPVVVNFAGLVGVAGGAGGVLRHVDVDCASERASDAGDSHSSPGSVTPATGGDYGSNVLGCNGLLSNANIFNGNNDVDGYALDDPDDAIGSAHTVCILSGALTSADNANISWSVQPQALHQDPADPNTNKIGLDVSGNANLEPCVSWKVGDVGVEQNITAIYVPTGDTIYSNGVRNTTPGPNFGLCPYDTSDGTLYEVCQPLIKEWNSIDVTTLVQASGAVGYDDDQTTYDLDENTGDLSNWGGRDGNDCSGASGDFCGRANLDGEVVTANGSTFFQAPNAGGFLIVTGRSFIDYTIGSHINYDGPVDGVQQTYSFDGDCGTAVVEVPGGVLGNPANVPGSSVLLGPGDSVTLITNSDKGVGFTISPADDGSLTSDPDNADCVDGECSNMSISTVESTLFFSNDPDTAADEDITVCFAAGPVPEKQPLLAWVGQRVVLSQDWTDVNGDCPWYPGPRGDTGPFYVRYLIQSPSPGAISDVPGGLPSVESGPDYIIVQVSDADNCISHAIYESQNQGRVDVTAHVVEFLSQPQATVNVVSPEHDFWYYYMKFEDATLTASDTDAIVSEDVDLTVTVRGWVLADNCPVKAAGQDSNGLLLPANRCTFPTDWAQVVGDDDQFDILGGSQSCGSNFAGPFGTLSGVPPDDCGDDSVAPHVDGGFRESTKSDGQVTAIDAPMPPAEVTFSRTGSGFLHGVDKASGEYQVTHIPAEPQIVPASPYLWHTWTGSGERSGLYNFWTDFIGVGDAVVSCPGDSPCDDGVATGGFDAIAVYSDNAGVAMAAINGDAELTFAECDNNLAAHLIIEPIDGHYCEQNDIVGTSTVSANVDYPDKKPHQDIDASSPVTITWRWGGIKDITTAPGETVGGEPISTYVILNVQDRDGFCDPSDSLHPVLGEIVEFQIDQGDGIIIEAEGSGVISGDQRSATTETFDTDGDSRTKGSPPADSCQAWILVSHSLGDPVDVRVTAHDPEGTIEFDTIISTTPAPTAPPPTPTPFNITVVWGNTDCSVDGIKSRDSQAILKRVLELPELSQDQPCPSIGQMVIIGGEDYQWGNFDCSADGVRARDSQAILKNVLQQTALSQTEECPDVGSDVVLEPVAIP